MWIIISVYIAILASITIWSRRETHWRLVAVLMALWAIPASYQLEQVVLGNPRSCQTIVKKTQIAGFVIQQPKIYLLTNDLVFCYMDYSDKDAEMLESEHIRVDGVPGFVTMDGERLGIEFPKELPKK